VVQIVRREAKPIIFPETRRDLAKVAFWNWWSAAFGIVFAALTAVDFIVTVWLPTWVDKLHAFLALSPSKHPLLWCVVAFVFTLLMVFDSAFRQIQDMRTESTNEQQHLQERIENLEDRIKDILADKPEPYITAEEWTLSRGEGGGLILRNLSKVPADSIKITIPTNSAPELLGVENEEFQTTILGPRERRFVDCGNVGTMIEALRTHNDLSPFLVTFEIDYKDGLGNAYRTEGVLNVTSYKVFTRVTQRKRM
jgi:hypothetical protein